MFTTLTQWLGSMRSPRLGKRRPAPTLARSLGVLICAALSACGRTDPSAPEGALIADIGSGPCVVARGVELVHAGAGTDAVSVILDQRTRARSEGRDLVVYVGATWCEPCRRFHAAAQKGALDGDFPNLTLLEFDLDADRDRLTPTGYVSRYIPLFAIPEPDGHASKRMFEGALSGDGAVANIAPRLRNLLRK